MRPAADVPRPSRPFASAGSPHSSLGRLERAAANAFEMPSGASSVPIQQEILCPSPIHGSGFGLAATASESSMASSARQDRDVTGLFQHRWRSTSVAAPRRLIVPARDQNKAATALEESTRRSRADLLDPSRSTPSPTVPQLRRTAAYRVTVGIIGCPLPAMRGMSCTSRRSSGHFQLVARLACLAPSKRSRWSGVSWTSLFPRVRRSNSNARL